MNIKSKRFLSLFTVAAAGALLFGCADETVLQSTSSISINPGVVSQNNFTLLFSDAAPTFEDTTTTPSTYSTVEVEVSAFIGDRNNRALTDAHTISFRTEWGLFLQPNCTTASGTCSVTWRSGSPDTAPTDKRNTIVAYTSGEESFTDSNDNGRFDDGDTFDVINDDIPEPYVDANSNGIFDASDQIIDINNDGVHNTADTFYNGPGCTHSTLCSTNQSITVWEGGALLLTGPP